MTQRILGSHPTTEELLEHCEHLLKTEKMTGPQIELIERLVKYRDDLTRTRAPWIRNEIEGARSRLLEIVGLYR